MKETPQQYIQRILGHIDGKDPLGVQAETPQKLQSLIKPFSKEQLSKRPAPDKWSISEILAHLADTELVGSWRMRSVLASSGKPIQAYDQDAWAKTFGYSLRDPQVSLATFRMLRENNLALLKAMPKDLWDNYGMHEERGKETITQIVRMFAGHDLNHLQQVETIARTLAA
jgi:DinB family protein